MKTQGPFKAGDSYSLLRAKRTDGKETLDISPDEVYINETARRLDMFQARPAATPKTTLKDEADGLVQECSGTSPVPLALEVRHPVGSEVIEHEDPGADSARSSRTSALGEVLAGHEGFGSATSKEMWCDHPN